MWLGLGSEHCSHFTRVGSCTLRIQCCLRLLRFELDVFFLGCGMGVLGV